MLAMRSSFAGSVIISAGGFDASSPGPAACATWSAGTASTGTASTGTASTTGGSLCLGSSLMGPT